MSHRGENISKQLETRPGIMASGLSAATRALCCCHCWVEGSPTSVSKKPCWSEWCPGIKLHNYTTSFADDPHNNKRLFSEPANYRRQKAWTFFWKQKCIKSVGGQTGYHGQGLPAVYHWRPGRSVAAVAGQKERRFKYLRNLLIQGVSGKIVSGPKIMIWWWFFNLCSCKLSKLERLCFIHLWGRRLIMYRFCSWNQKLKMLEGLLTFGFEYGQS